MLQLNDANSSEFEPQTTDPVIYLMSDQEGLVDTGGTMRLGVYPCKLINGSRAKKAYGADLVYERHRHRYEVNNKYLDNFAKVGFEATGVSPDGNLVEIMEFKNHEFMLGVQFHPEFLSRPNRPHPLFTEFVNSAKNTLREGGQHSMLLDKNDKTEVSRIGDSSSDAPTEMQNSG